jgi:hypothetical protein
MRIAWRLGAVAALVAISLLLRPAPPFAQEEGRPAFVHDRGVDARDRARGDDRRDATDEGRRRGLDGSGEGRSRSLTEVEKVARESDLTKGKDAEFHDLKTLQAEIRADEAATKQHAEDSGVWRANQANHAWEGHQEEFQKIGISDEGRLQAHIDDVRKNPDVTVILPRGRELYARIDDGVAGTIVIDNPSDKTGGTAFRTDNVLERVRQIRDAP